MYIDTGRRNNICIDFVRRDDICIDLVKEAFPCCHSKENFYLY